MVEHPAVNGTVVGSSPTQGAISNKQYRLLNHRISLYDENKTGSLSVMEVPVVTKRFGGGWERKERNDRPSESTPQ